MQAVEATIQAACDAAARPRSTVQLLAVSKMFPPEAVLEAVEAGQRAFGENYLQEGIDKIAAVARVVSADTPWQSIVPDHRAAERQPV